MYEPAANDEISGLVNYLDEQLTAIRAAAIGLTEAEVRMQPCRSTLSVGGLIKHATHVMRGATERLTGQSAGPAVYDEAALEVYVSSFRLGEDETALGTLAASKAASVPSAVSSSPNRKLET